MVVLPFNLFSVPFSFTTAAPTFQLFSHKQQLDVKQRNRLFCGGGGDCGELRALITLHWAEWPEKEEESVVQSMNLAQKQQQLQGPCVVTDHLASGTDK